MSDRFTTCSDRYEIGNIYGGWQDTATNRNQAFRRAARLAQRDEVPSHVFDRMARRGMAQKWEVNAEGTATVVSYRGPEAA